MEVPLDNQNTEIQQGSNLELSTYFLPTQCTGAERRSLTAAPLSEFHCHVLSPSPSSPLPTTPKMEDLHGYHHHEYNSDHPQSPLQNFHPHNAQLWCTELGKSNGQEGWAAIDNGGVGIKGAGALQWVAILKSCLQNFHPHNVRQWNAELGKSNEGERWAAVDNGGVTIKAAGALQQVAILKSCLDFFHLHDVRQWSTELGKSNGRERWAAADNDGIRIKGAGALCFWPPVTDELL
jgi:hypothetical protein